MYDTYKYILYTQYIYVYVLWYVNPLTIVCIYDTEYLPGNEYLPGKIYPYFEMQTWPLAYFESSD